VSAFFAIPIFKGKSDCFVVSGGTVPVTSTGPVTSHATGLPSSVCVVGCAFVMAVSVYQISKTKTEI